MNTILNDIIKEGYDIQKGIYPDSGGGLYATYSFKDHNKYLKWAINTTKFIEETFQEMDIARFKAGIRRIDNELSISEFNKLLFLLESYNNNDQKTTFEPKVIDILLEAIRMGLSENQIGELRTIILQEKDISLCKGKLIEKLNSFGSNVSASILASILSNSAIKEVL